MWVVNFNKAKNNDVIITLHITEAYSEPCQTSKMDVFVKTVQGFQLLTIFAKSFILDVQQVSERDIQKVRSLQREGGGP